MLIARQLEKDSKRINVVSVSADTTWSCSVDGNFILTAYEGSGDTEITISALNDDDHTARGTIHFIYKENDCMKQFDCPIWYVDYGWIRVSPTVEHFKKGLNNEYKAFNVESGDGVWIFGDVPNFFKKVKISSNRFYLIKTNNENCVIELKTEVTFGGEKRIHVLVVN
jgi:hypothetical protein